MKKIHKLRWRLDNLYRIVDKKGNDIEFNMNAAQERLFNNFHYLNIIPKARQLGMSTFIDVLFLDACIFNRNVSAGIICHTREDAEEIFRTKIKYPYENLPESIRRTVVASRDSARHLSFSNGSSIRVGTSLRGSTLNYLHISEFGKICAKYPEKADEIVSGSLNTVHPGNFIFIESTAEGRGGFFYEYTKIADKNEQMDRPLGELDFKLHFFPWWEHYEYVLDGDVIISSDLTAYFDEVELLTGRAIPIEKRRWYTKKKEQQGEFIYREYPSTLDECFLVSNEGFFYVRQFAEIRKDKRISRVPYDTAVNVDTFWDLGMDDTTAIWFVQKAGQEIHLIDYYENSNEGLAHYVKVLQEKKDYCYGNHWFPHDIKVRELGTGVSRLETLRTMGLRNSKIVPKIPIEDGIEAARNLLGRCWFDEDKCSKGIKSLENYKKEWNDKLSSYSNRPLHNWCSHAADAFRSIAIKSKKVGSEFSVSQEQADEMFQTYTIGV